MNDKSVIVDTQWTETDWSEHEELGTHVIRIAIDGLGLEHSDTVLINGVETNDWFGLTVDEARDLYFGLGVMLGEYDEAEFGQS